MRTDEEKREGLYEKLTWLVGGGTRDWNQHVMKPPRGCNHRRSGSVSYLVRLCKTSRLGTRRLLKWAWKEEDLQKK